MALLQKSHIAKLTSCRLRSLLRRQSPLYISLRKELQQSPALVVASLVELLGGEGAGRGTGVTSVTYGMMKS